MGFLIEGQGVFSPNGPAWTWCLLAVAIGICAGAVELIGRYKDAPFKVLIGPSASFYVFVNALVSFIAYVLIVAFDVKFATAEGDTHKELVQALVAGFGAMVFFRSSLFSVRVGQTDVLVGPALLFQVLLFATDRQCDRERAEPRSALVAEIMRGVDFEKAREALPNYCFELMQNVATNEQNQFVLVVKALASSPTRNDIKSLTLGLMLMNVVGSQVLRVAVRALGPRIQGPAQLELLTLGQLQMADFSKAFPLLANVSFIMSTYGTDDEQQKARQDVLDKIREATRDTALDNSSKMTLLGLLLQQYVGDAVLESALRAVREAITPSKKPGEQPGSTPEAAKAADKAVAELAAAADKAAADQAAADKAAADKAAADQAAADKAAADQGAAVQAAADKAAAEKAATDEVAADMVAAAQAGGEPPGKSAASSNEGVSAKPFLIPPTPPGAP